MKMRALLLAAVMACPGWTEDPKPPAVDPPKRLSLAQKCRVAIWPVTAVNLEDSSLAEAIVGQYGFLRAYQNAFSDALSEGILDVLDKESLPAGRVRDLFKETDVVSMLDLREAIKAVQPQEVIGPATPNVDVAPVRKHAALKGVRYLVVPLQMTLGSETKRVIDYWSHLNANPGMWTTPTKEVTTSKAMLKVALVDMETFTLVCTDEVTAKAGSIKRAGVHALGNKLIQRLRALLAGKESRPATPGDSDSRSDK